MGRTAGRSSEKKSQDGQQRATPGAEYPLGDLNPCYRTENPGSWATRRRGRSGCFSVAFNFGSNQVLINPARGSHSSPHAPREELHHAERDAYGVGTTSFF